MAGFEAGGGASVAALGPLQRMWREVYRKATAAAEARAVALLKQHVYVYPHSAGGGGGGGGWVLLDDRTLAAAGEAFFTDIAQTYRDLRVVLDGRATGTGLASGDVRMQLGSAALGGGVDTGGNAYRSSLHFAQVGSSNHLVSAAIGGTQNRDYHAMVGSVPGELATDAGATGVIDLVLYHYTLTDRYKRFFAVNTLTGNQTSGAQTRHASGEWRSTAAITRVNLYAPSGDGWAAGTVVRLYGWTDTPPAAALGARLAALEARLAALEAH
jgi:hypothetical protein